MEAIILAGGQGTRLKEVLPDTPKPMAPIEGHPFLEYLLDYWVKQGVSRFILSVGYKAEQIMGYFGDSFGPAAISYAVEQEPLGTAGGLRCAASLLKERAGCLILNGDTYFCVDLKGFSTFHRTRRSELTIALRSIENGKRYDSVELDGTKRIRHFKTDRKSEGESQILINGGVYMVSPEVLKKEFRNKQETSFEKEVLCRLIENERRIFGFESESVFIDIGVPADYKRATHLLNPTLLSVRRLKNAS
jgi:D-glycero-alpha-D-manno-heptose 1-phosphate guanylyltransferase